MTRRTSKVTNFSRTKVRRHALWLKILKIQILVKIKLFTLLLRMNLIMIMKKMMR